MTPLSDNLSQSPVTKSINCDYEEDEFTLPNWAKVLGGIGMIIVILLAVVGNLMVIISYFRDKQLQTVHNMYILNLAITDFFIGAISMTFYADFTLRSWEWIFGRVFCNIWCMVDYSMTLHSILLVIILSYDRLLLLINGAKYISKETKRVARIKLVISWTISFAVYGPCVLFWEFARGYSVIEEGNCEPEFYSNFGFSTVSMILEMTISCIAVSVINIRVYLEIRKRINLFKKGKVIPVDEHKREITVSSEVNGVAAEATMAADALKSEVKAKEKQSKTPSERRDIKAAKYLAVLVRAFIVSWVPYTFGNLILSQCADCVNVHLEVFFTWLLWSKSSINPFLYAYHSKQFKSNFLSILPFTIYSRSKGRF